MRTKSIGLMIAISPLLGKLRQREPRLTSRHQPPYALMYEDNPDP